MIRQTIHHGYSQNHSTPARPAAGSEAMLAPGSSRSHLSKQATLGTPALTKAPCATLPRGSGLPRSVRSDGRRPRWNGGSARRLWRCYKISASDENQKVLLGVRNDRTASARVTGSPETPRVPLLPCVLLQRAPPLSSSVCLSSSGPAVLQRAVERRPLSNGARCRTAPAVGRRPAV